jgi:hypothetical protein
MLREILKCQYTDLGRTVLDGVEVQGFQTTDPAYGGGLGDVDVTVWVNRKTELPVRIDMKIKMNEQMEMEGTLHDFQWDVPVSAAEFTPVIPPDYTAAPGDGIKVPPRTRAPGGLRFCVESPEYPKDLSLMTLMQTAGGIQGQPAGPRSPGSERYARHGRTEKKVIEDDAHPALGGFYATLVQEKKAR